MKSPRLLASLITIALASCAAGPDYHRPDIGMAAQWQAPLPHGASTDQLRDWWSQFSDPALAQLQQAAQQNSPTLARAEASIRGARANAGVARGAFLPAVAATASAARTGDNSTDDPLVTTRRAGFDATWEIDLFGRVRRSVEAAEAEADARAADWHDARVSVAAEVATTYVDYRACRLKTMALEESLASQRTTARLTALSVDAGFTRPADSDLASAGTAAAADSAIAQATDCELLVKSLVALTGLDEPALRERLGAQPAPIPVPAEFDVDSVPAALLTQRPDVVAAERTLAAASAQIGIAQAARWPNLTLLGSIATADTEGITTTPWSFGPTLSLPLFQGGALRSRVAAAEAGFDDALARYRQAVTTAVREVEQSLVQLDGTARRAEEARASAEHYRKYFGATEMNWRAGRSSLLDLETVRRAALSAELNLITLQQSRVNAWITLYKAMGGGWHDAAADKVADGGQP